MFVDQHLCSLVCKGTSAEGRIVYESDWKEVDGVEMKRFIGLTILIGACKSKNENVLQLQSQKGLPLINKIMGCQRF